MTDITLYWLRQDLRLHDNPALLWAASRGAVVPVYIDDTSPRNKWAAGGASRWWLHHALDDIAKSYAALGVDLIIRRGEPLKILQEIVKETKATAVTWNRCYEPYARERDENIKTTLRGAGLEVESHNASLLVEPWEVKTGSGTPYKVYTPFSKACMAVPIAKPQAASKVVNGIKNIASDKLSTLKLLPHKPEPDWSGGIAEAWKPTQEAAKEILQDFVADKMSAYKSGRDRPDQDATSRLSPYLHFGQISPRAAWHLVQSAVSAKHETAQGGEVYSRELLWREFSYHLLFHFPTLPDKPFNERFTDFPWVKNAKALHAWQKGMTGYPIVDAGMRQLWQTGWMHNRVRMVVASFLVKHLLVPWQAGEAWFWDTLVDADLASNAASWQWVAGCGADAAPYFRIFNPMLQGQKFDPNGDYVRRYVPELAKLPADFIHEPWKATPLELAQAGVKLGDTYPLPIVDHNEARQGALDALKRIKEVAN